MATQLRHEDYTIGWISALPIELAAAQKCLDKRHAPLPAKDGDDNVYVLGEICGHKTVMACLPAGRTGTISAASVAMQMKASYRSIRFGLMVGVGGGVPSDEHDIRLGDVVVSQPSGQQGGVVQYDFGKSKPGEFERTGWLNAPPSLLLNALSALQAAHVLEEGSFWTNISELEKLPNFARSKAGEDVLFHAAYNHVPPGSCAQCNPSMIVPRETRAEQTVHVHYGTIASGNQVMRYAKERDKVSAQLGGALCFEMEAAGLMNSFPCLVIRGICDYADSHKSKGWQPYAAATAAAYGKDLLSVIPREEVARAQTAEQATSAKRIISLPFSRNNNFVGREGVLQNLDSRFFDQPVSFNVAIHGLGGIGKTQIALSFARLVEQKYPDISIFWITALSTETIEKSLLEIANLLNIKRMTGDTDDIKTLVRQRLERPEAGRWMLIIDNLDDENLIDYTQECLPRGDPGIKLLTTRTYDVVHAFTGSDGIEVMAMERSECIDLMQRSLRQPEVLDNDHAIDDLLEKVASLPLALTQAIAYINRNRITLERYLDLLGQSDQSMVQMMSIELRDRTRYQDASNAVAATWVVSFEQILEQDHVAADLLKFISCVEWRAIPYSMLPGQESQVDLQSALGTLCSYSFLTPRLEGDKYDMHRLVHLAARVWTDRRMESIEVWSSAITHLADIFPSHAWENREIWREFMPHAAHITSTDQRSGREKKAELYFWMAQCLNVDGMYGQSIRWLRQCCSIRDVLDDHDPVRLTARHNLAISLWFNNDLAEARNIMEDVVEIRTQSLQEGNHNLIASQQVLGSIYLDLGQVDQGIELLKHVVKIQMMLHASDDATILDSLHELAGAYMGKGRVQDAIELFGIVVRVGEQLHEEDDPGRLISQHELGRAYLESGQLDEAIGTLKRVVMIRQSVAEDNSHRLASEQELARAYLKDGQVDKAIELFERVVDIQAKILHEDAINRLVSEQFFAQALMERRTTHHTARAIQILEHVVDVQRRSLWTKQSDPIASLELLADAYGENGQPQKQGCTLDTIYDIVNSLPEKEDPSLLVFMHNLASRYLKIADVDNVCWIDKAILLLEVVTATKKEMKRLDTESNRGVLESRLAEEGNDLAWGLAQRLQAQAYLVNGQDVEKATHMLETVVKSWIEKFPGDDVINPAAEEDLRIGREMLKDSSVRAVFVMPMGRAPRLRRYQECEGSTARRIEELSIEDEDQGGIALG